MNQDPDQELFYDEEDTHWDNDFRRILHIDDYTFEHLKMMSLWAHRFSVCGFILAVAVLFSCLLITISAAHIAILRHLGTSGFVLVCLLLALIIAYPSYCFYQFAITLKSVIAYPHQGRFNSAVNMLHKALRSMAIISLLLLAIGSVAFVLWLML